MGKITITIDNEEYMLLIEKYFFELTGRKIALLQFLTEDKFPIEDAMIDKALAEYVKSFTEANMVFNYITHPYLKDETNINYRYELDFVNRAVTIIPTNRYGKTIDSEDSCMQG